MSRNDAQKDFMWGVLVGGSVAALVALLFTTKKGRQLQDEIVSLYEEIEDSVKDTFAEAGERVGDVVDQVGKKIDHFKEKASEAKDDLEDAAEHTRKKMAHKLKNHDHRN